MGLLNGRPERRGTERFRMQTGRAIPVRCRPLGRVDGWTGGRATHLLGSGISVTVLSLITIFFPRLSPFVAGVELVMLWMLDTNLPSLVTLGCKPEMYGFRGTRFGRFELSHFHGCRARRKHKQEGTAMPGVGIGG